MKTFHWGVQPGFPHIKVFILGIWLTLLGTTCVVISVIGIVKMVWGCSVGTGMWGGMVITMTGLATMYMARVRTSLSAKLYLSLSVLDILISFTMLVLSAGGLTYKSNFYAPVRFDPSTHQFTLFLHGSVLSVSVVSLACSVLSVIVLLKFITFEKGRRVETFKLRRHRHRFSDPNGVYRTGSLPGGSGSGSTVRASTSSRVPLVSSDRSQRHSRQSSYSDSGSLRVSGVSRRDSDRSRGSARSRPSHHRQSSSASQQSRYEPLHSRQNSGQGGSDSVYSTLTRENHRAQLCVNLGPNGGGDSFHHPRPAVRGLQCGERQSVQPVFDSDEEPVPPYEESETNTGFSSNTGEESDVENSEPSLSQTLDDSSSTLFGTSHLPLNIPVTEVGTPHSNGRPNNVRSGLTAQIHGINYQSFSQPCHPLGMAVSQGIVVDNARVLLRGNRGSPEICALTGERETPSTLRGSPSPHESTSTLHPSSDPSSSTQWIMTERESAQVSHLNHSSDSSDTSLLEHERSRVHEEAVPSGARLATSDPHSLVSVPGRREGDSSQIQPVSSDNEAGSVDSSCASSGSTVPLSLGSPNSAFRPVGRTVPVAQISPSEPAPTDKLFSPISSSDTGLSNSLESSSESLARASAPSWKMIPLPSSHNHSNRASSVPTKELSSKNIPINDFHSPNVYGQGSDSQSLLSRNARIGATSAEDIVSGLVSPRYRNLLQSSTHGASNAMHGSSSSTHSASSASHSASSATQSGGAVSAIQGTSTLQFSTLPHRRAPAADTQLSARNSFHQTGSESSQRAASRDTRQRHTVELPSSVRTQPLMGVSASGLNSRGRVDREGLSGLSSRGRGDGDGQERRSGPLMMSARHSGHSLSFNPPSRPSTSDISGQNIIGAAGTSRSGGQSLSAHLPSRSAASGQQHGARAQQHLVSHQRNQLSQQPRQQLRQPQNHQQLQHPQNQRQLQQPGNQPQNQQPQNQQPLQAGNQQQAQQQVAGQVAQQQAQPGQPNRPLFSVLL